MNPLLAASIVIGLALGASVVGVLTNRRAGRRRRPSVGDVVADDVDLRSLGDLATVVQFSTEYCSRCPGLRRALVSELAGHDDVAYTDVDLTHRPQLASRMKVLQTPTVLVVDARGHVAARYSGTVPPASIRAEINALRDRSDVALA